VSFNKSAHQLTLFHDAAIYKRQVDHCS